MRKEQEIKVTKESELDLRKLGRKTDIILRRNMAYSLMGIFTINTVATMFLIFLVGLGQMNLSNQVIITILGATIAQAAAMFLMVTKYLFPAHHA